MTFDINGLTVDVAAPCFNGNQDQPTSPQIIWNMRYIFFIDWQYFWKFVCSEFYKNNCDYRSVLFLGI